MQLSIIIPAYNVEPYLSACIDSLVADIYESNTSKFEIIIVNDGSTDNTYVIADAYAQKYDFIRVVDKPNGGLSDARNSGIAQASGSFISFIDSDDIIKHHFISDILNLIENYTEVDIISFDIHKFFGSPEFSDSIFVFNIIPKEFYCSKPLITCNKIYNRKLLNTKIFPVGKYYEDVWTTPSIIFESEKFIHINNDYYGYRQRQGSITANIDSKYMDILGALDVISKHTKDNFIKNVMVSQFFTLMLLSLRLPFRMACQNIDKIFEFFAQQHNIKPFNNKLHERLAFNLFALFKNNSKFIFLLCRPAVMLHLSIKKYRGR